MPIQVISMPAKAEILCVQAQNGKPCIWAMVDIEADKDERTFHIYGTGHPVETGANLIYIGTFQQNNGVFVFHLFEFFN